MGELSGSTMKECPEAPARMRLLALCELVGPIAFIFAS
jgi:hypothetical protein